MDNTSSFSHGHDRVVQAASTRQMPTVFVISPPPSSAAARVRQRYQKENRTSTNHSLKSSSTDTKRSLNFGFDLDPSKLDDETFSIADSFKSLNLGLALDESDLPCCSDNPTRKAIVELIKRTFCLNQAFEELKHKNSSLESAIAVLKDNEVALHVEIEHRSRTIYSLKNRLSNIEQEQKFAEKKAKICYSNLEKKFNAIRFKDKQYNNELRKREVECEKIQKKLRSVMLSCKTGVEPSSLRSSFQKQAMTKPPNIDLQKDLVLLREDNQRMDRRLRAVYQENTCMRELFALIIKKMQTSSDDYALPSDGLDMNLPFEFSGEQLKASVMGLLEKLIAASNTPSKTNEHSEGDNMSTICDLKQIIKQQEDRIRRSIFKEPEMSPKCRYCNKINSISPINDLS